MKTAQLIKPNGSITNVCPEDCKVFTLSELQKLVGGYIELPFQLDNGCYVICDEEGRLKKKQPNLLATDFALCGGANIDYYLVGDVLICPSDMLE